MLTSILSWIGSLSASAGTTACLLWVMDEPKMPKSLLNK